MYIYTCIHNIYIYIYTYIYIYILGLSITGFNQLALTFTCQFVCLSLCRRRQQAHPRLFSLRQARAWMRRLTLWGEIPVGGTAAHRGTILEGALPRVATYKTIPVWALHRETIPEGALPRVKAIPVGALHRETLPVGALHRETIPVAALHRGTVPEGALRTRRRRRRRRRW